MVDEISLCENGLTASIRFVKFDAIAKEEPKRIVRTEILYLFTIVSSVLSKH